MFLPRFVPGSCKPQYVRNESQAQFHLNAIPLENVSDIGSGWRVYFPRPWQMIGLCENPIPDLPSGEFPSWPMVLPRPTNPAEQNTYAEMSPAFMLELCLASMQPPPDPDGFDVYPVTYIDGGQQKQSYRGYFTRLMNDELITTRQAWFNPFMTPSSMWAKFAQLHAADTEEQWFSAFLEFIKYTSKYSDQRLYGAPGVYTIFDQSSTYQWELQSEFLFIITG